MMKHDMRRIYVSMLGGDCEPILTLVVGDPDSYGQYTMESEWVSVQQYCEHLLNNICPGK